MRDDQRSPSSVSAGSEKYHQCGCMSSATVSSALRFFLGYGMARIVVTVAGAVGASRWSRTPSVQWRGWMPTALLHGLDAGQLEAVTSTAAPLAIIAAAGSGKTTVLTRRIAHRIATGTGDHRHTLALTFTRDAAGELRRRLRALDLRDPIEAGTFHSVALRLLRDRALARHESAPRVATDRLRLVRECLTELRLDASPSSAMADLDWARARLVAPERYEEQSRRARRSAVPPAALRRRSPPPTTQLKRRRGVVDFDDLLERALQAVRDDADVRRGRPLAVPPPLRRRGAGPQPAAARACWSRGAAAARTCASSAIRARRSTGGTVPRAPRCTEVERRYPGVTVIALTTNYRCTPQVVRAGAAALRGGGLRRRHVE